MPEITKDDIKIVSIEHHRNGVGGEPFYAVLFNWHDDHETEDRLMLGIVFTTTEVQDSLLNGEYYNPATAVLDVGLAAAGNVSSGMAGNNGWRGDHFDDALREHILEDLRMKGYEDAEAPVAKSQVAETA